MAVTNAAQGPDLHRAGWLNARSSALKRSARLPSGRPTASGAMAEASAQMAVAVSQIAAQAGQSADHTPAVDEGRRNPAYGFRAQ